MFRAYGELYHQQHRMTPEQLQVFRDIVACRTAVLGGHLDVCPDCGFERPAYNSCRNRHCPKCQAMRQAAWIEGRMARILPCPYFHVVFTLPAELRPVARRHPRLVYHLLFEAASQTLLDLGSDPKRLGAQLGFTAVLHTWTRELKYHPHLHCVVTGGGLSRDGSQWIPIRRSKYLFPVRVLGDLFRGKFLAGLRRLGADGQLDLGAILPPRRLERLYTTPWVVYAKRPFGGPEQVYRYLGRYTHRIAISNHRLVSHDERGVTFRTKNGKSVTIAGDEFIRRFLLHVLPKRFTRLRHYGLMAPANATTRLEQARQLLRVAEHDGTSPTAPSPPTDKTWVDRVIELTGVDPTVCPHCAATLVRRRLPARTPRPRAQRSNPIVRLDSS